jgi:pyridoxal phosphate enzyme (YggS family)
VGLGGQGGGASSRWRITAVSDLPQRLEDVRRRIAAAAERAGRDPSAVRLVAVTKTVDAARVAEVVALGVRDLGENRVQEAASKAAELPDGLRWHLIGHLQTNKAARAAQLFDVVHSVDGPRVAEALSQRRQGMAPLDALLEVELTGIPGHTGVPEDGLVALARAVMAMPNLRLRGLMTMAPPVADPAEARPTFARLRDLRHQLQESIGQELPELSMGMSNDYEVAVEEGATIVRLGRALLGERPPRRPGPE